MEANLTKIVHRLTFEFQYGYFAVESSFFQSKASCKTNLSYNFLARTMQLLSIYFLLLLCFLPHSNAIRKSRLTWVNGIAHNLHHMELGQAFISQLFGGKPVLYCHNPTSMSSDEDYLGYIGDLTQAGTQKLGRITDEVNALVQHLQDAVAAVGKHGVVVHIAHSQGALVTSLAAQQLTPLQMSHIEIIGFGGAAALRKTPTTPFRRCINYYSVNDPLLLLVPSAAQALRSGFVGDEEFCFLLPRIGDPIRDHNLLGDTYASALEWEGKRFQREYMPVWGYSAVQVILVMKSMWNMLQRVSDKYGELVALYILRPLLILLHVIVVLIQELIRVLWRDDRYVPLQDAIENYPG